MEKAVARRKKHPSAGLGMEGFYRVNLVETKGKNRGKLVGDSGWKHNIITDRMSNYITQLFLSAAGSSFIKRCQLGSATTAASDQRTMSSLPGEYAKSQMCTLATASTSRAASTDGDTARFTGTFASNFAGASSTVACIGLYNTTDANSVFCGGSFASSTFGTTQAINITYDIVFLASTS